MEKTFEAIAIDKFGEIIGYLKDMSVTLNQHTSDIAEIKSTLAEHSRDISEIKTTLAEHSAILKEHSNDITEIKVTLNLHTRQHNDTYIAVKKLINNVLDLDEQLNSKNIKSKFKPLTSTN